MGWEHGAGSCQLWEHGTPGPLAKGVLGNMSARHSSEFISAFRKSSEIHIQQVGNPFSGAYTQ